MTAYCLVRAKSAEDGEARIVENVSKYDPSFPELLVTNHHRFVAVVGDLAKPNVGVEAAMYKTLLSVVDVIIHNGALVNFSYPYLSMKAANVDGTKALLRMACTSKQKLLHYVSTLSVLPHGVSGEGPVGDRREKLRLGPSQGRGGYAESGQWRSSNRGS
jgi:thioester reductase-like protein